MDNRVLPLLVVGALALTIGLALVLSDRGAANPSAACGAVQTFPILGGSHLIGEQQPPIPYNSIPGTSGWHDSGRPRSGVYTEPLTEPQIVSVLEIGNIVVAYDATAVAPASLTSMTAAAEASRGEVTLTPFAGLAAPIVMNAWGTQQGCDAFVPADLEAFVAAHQGRGPDAG